MSVKLGILFFMEFLYLLNINFKTIFPMEVLTDKTTNGARHYQKNYTDFNYYIETIGTVTIDEVTLNNNELKAIYSYKQGNQIRNVISLLKLDTDGFYKGTCTTKVNNKTLFSVNTWLRFNKNGTASGNWSWSGTPTNNDPIIKISKK